MHRLRDFLTKIYFFRIHPLVIVLPFCFWGLYRRTHWRLRYDLWVDEQGQIGVMDMPFWQFIQHLPKSEYCAYLSGDYYLIYPFFKIFGSNKWGLAIPHIIITILGFYLAYLICKKYMKSIWGFTIAFAIIALNEELKLHAFEIRTYAVLPTLALASFYFQNKLFLENEIITWKQRLIFGLFFTITLLWHAYGILVTFLPTIYFLGTVLRKPKIKIIFKKVISFFAPVVIAASPIWLISVFGKHLEVHRYGTFEYTPNPLVAPVAFLKFIFGNLMGSRKLYFLLAGLVLCILLPIRERYKLMGFFLILIAFPLALLFLVNVRAEYWFIQRQFIWVIPYFALLMGFCWEAIIEYFLGLNKGAAS